MSTGTEAWSIGALGGIITASENDLNALITRANNRGLSITTGQFANAYEFAGYLQRRFNGSVFALQLRPSYFTDSTTGSGSGGSYNYALTGYTIMPLIRAYILESSGIKLFIQGGVGFGSLSGSVTEGAANINFSGNSYGYQAGIGVNFCFGSRSQHCVVTEGNLRYMAFERNIVSSVNGTFATGPSPSISQSSKGQEVEIDGHDLGTTMSGIQGIVGYQYNL